MIFHHWIPAKSIINFLPNGPLGVNIFFVLSGFLVGGLIYKEYITTGSFRPKRFLIRRGFKIYPTFYFFIFISVIVKLVYLFRGVEIQYFTFSNVLAECFFVQNYFKGLWLHTWSLAIEEHFYLLLVILFLTAIKFKLIQNRNFVRGFIISTFIICLSLRLYLVFVKPISMETNYSPTHLRIDSLFFGVLLADYYYYNRQEFKTFFKNNKYWLFVTSLVLLSPLLFFASDSIFINSIGFTSLFIAFGIILGLFLSTGILILLKKIISTKVIIAISTIGYYSYSIYLWHMFVSSFFISVVVNSIFTEGIHYRIIFAIYFLISIIVGIILSELVEIPMLRFREKFFPAISSKVK